MSVANTDYDLVLHLRASIGAGRITNKCIAKKHHSPSFVFAIYSRQALQLLRQITPYLRTYKRARAELLLQRYLLVTPRNGRYTTELLAARSALETSFFEIRSRIGACANEAGTPAPPRSLVGGEHARSSAGDS